MQAQFQYFLVANMLYWIKSLLLAALTISIYLWIQRYTEIHWGPTCIISYICSMPHHFHTWYYTMIQHYPQYSHQNMNHSSTKAILWNNNVLVSVFPVNNFYLFVVFLLKKVDNFDICLKKEPQHFTLSVTFCETWVYFILLRVARYAPSLW